MPYKPHGLMSIRGVFASGGVVSETWSMNLRWGTEAATAPVAVTQGMIDDCAADYATFHTNGTSKIANNCDFKEIRWYPIDTDGHATAEPVIGNTDPASGAVATNHFPSQVALVIGFKATGLGKGKLGRVYLPGVCHPINNDGLAAASEVLATLNNFKTFLTAAKGHLAGALPANPELIIAGQTGAGGTARFVTHLRVGRVLDTMRSRRRSLVEAYQEVGI